MTTTSNIYSFPSTGEHYRQIPAISNSDLTEYKHYLFGRKFRKPHKAFEFGTTLHQVILEPHLSPQPIGEGTGEGLTVDMELINHLAKKVRSDKFCKWITQFSSKEQVNLFTDPTTHLDCKSKLDLVYKNSLVVDLKTTSQPNYEAFLKSCLEYDYDRQAAFYLDSIGGKRFIFIGIQKKAPYNLFYFDASKEPNFIEKGRKKYRALLKKWKEDGSFVPSSWVVPMVA